MTSLELEIIEYIRKKAATNKDLIVGIGDDCAVWRVPKGYQEVVSFDSLFEGIHFDFRFTSIKDLAWRAAARALSDLAACGAKPKFCLLGLGLPKQTSKKSAELFALEFIKALKKYSVALVGGDISESNKWVIGVTAVGVQKKERILLRSQASSGEYLFVTGCTGLAAAGLDILKNRSQLAPKFPTLVRAYLQPSPRIFEGLFLSNRRIATSAIDISDGLLLDAWRLAESSGIAIVIEKEKIPLANSLKKYCQLIGKTVEQFISAGDDYELLFTVPADKVAMLKRLKKNFYEIGYTKEGRGVFIQDKTGKLTKAPKEGYLHLKG